MLVYLVTKGDGSDGDEWYVVSIFTSKEKAERFIIDHNAHRPSWAAISNEVEEWKIDQDFNPADYPNDKPKVK